MKFSLSLLFAMALLITARAQSSFIAPKLPTNPTRPDVVKAAKFAVNDRYVLEDVTYKILIAKIEWSLSTRLRTYLLKIAVTEDDGASCTVMSYAIEEKFGAPANDQYTFRRGDELTNEKC